MFILTWLLYIVSYKKELVVMDKRLKSLVSLLDDESQQSASFAMAELLGYEEELESILCELQESDNPRIRCRVHQLESILNIRKRRKKLSEHITQPNADLFKGLVELHVQWYDNDSRANIAPFWRAFVENSKRHQIDSLEKLGYFMQKYGFRTSERGEIFADYFCIGIVMEELIGCSLNICAIAQKLASIWDFHVTIVQISEEFCLMDAKGNILAPGSDWAILDSIDFGKHMPCSTSTLLKYILNMLFLCAVSSDSFRYINTIGHILAAVCNEKNLSNLPMPYKSKY